MPDGEFNLRAFVAYLRGQLRAPEQKRAMGLQSSAAGGYLVPDKWVGFATIARASRFIRRYAQMAGVIVPTTTNLHAACATTLPTVAKIARGVSGQHDVTPTDAVLSTFRITDGGTKGPMPLETVSGAVVATNEMSADAINDEQFTDFVGRMLAEALAAEEQRQFIVGLGPASNECYGLSRQATNTNRVVNNTLAPGAVGMRDLMAMIRLLGEGRYERACWIASPEAVAAMATEMLVVNEGDPQAAALQMVCPCMDGGLQLIGRPLHISNHLADPSVGNSVVLYDPYEYFIGEQIGSFYVQRLDELYAANARTGWVLCQRLTANILNPAGLVALTPGS